MTKQTGGKIFLADQRGVCKTDNFLRYSTFNFGSFYHAHKQPFGSLYVWNEEMLAGSQSTTLNLAAASQVIIIPVTGDVQVTDPAGAISMVQVEEIYVQTIAASRSVQLTNPYTSEVITFLLICIHASLPVASASSQLYRFDANTINNRLFPVIGPVHAGDVTEAYPFQVSIGRFGGRQEAVYPLQNASSMFFAFIMAGAFEIEGRLLHEKDGLALWNYRETELEALSKDALVVIIELAGRLQQQAS